MKRNINGIIEFELIDDYSIKTHDVSTQNGIGANWNCYYQKVNLKTDSNNIIEAFKYLNNNRLICYDISLETPQTRTIFKESHIHHFSKANELNQNYDASFNCFGFTNLDGQYWLDLTQQNLNQILTEDRYIETDDANSDQLIVYYENESPVHISSFNFATGLYNHKIGCNLLLSRNILGINDIYQECNNIKRYEKRN